MFGQSNSQVSYKTNYRNGMYVKFCSIWYPYWTSEVLSHVIVCVEVGVVSQLHDELHHDVQDAVHLPHRKFRKSCRISNERIFSADYEYQDETLIEPSEVCLNDRNVVISVHNSLILLNDVHILSSFAHLLLDSTFFELHENS